MADGGPLRFLVGLRCHQHGHHILLPGIATLRFLLCQHQLITSCSMGCGPDGSCLPTAAASLPPSPLHPVARTRACPRRCLQSHHHFLQNVVGSKVLQLRCHPRSLLRSRGGIMCNVGGCWKLRLRRRRPAACASPSPAPCASSLPAQGAAQEAQGAAHTHTVSCASPCPAPCASSLPAPCASPFVAPCASPLMACAAARSLYSDCAAACAACLVCPRRSARALHRACATACAT